VLSQEGEKAALSMLSSGQCRSAKQVSQCLKAEGVIERVLHKSTVIRAAQRAAAAIGQELWVQRGKPPKAMTKATKEKRLQSAKTHLISNFSTWLFSDRKKFLFLVPWQ
jgi:hypothetical protein